MKQKSNKRSKKIINGIFIVVCLMIVFYAALKVSNMTVCKISITYNGKKIENANQINLNITHDSQKGKKIWEQRKEDKIMLVHNAEGLSENTYTVRIPYKTLSENSPIVKCKTDYYNTREFDWAVLLWNIDITEKNGKWIINSKVKSKHLFSEETSKKTFKVGKEKANYVM